MQAEETIYIGHDTAAAAAIRNHRITSGLQATPLQWLSTVLAAILGHRADHTPVALRDRVPFARGVLRGLGYDADTHELSRRRGQNPGFVVRDGRGHPVRFVSARALRRLQSDGEFLAAFGDETSDAE